MSSCKNNTNSNPFYIPIYKQVLFRLNAGESIENIYDDRGRNLLKNLKQIDKSICENALEIGCGLGQVSISLSTEYKTVVALDMSRDALKVLTLIAKKQNVSNVHPILGDATHLPFKENSFNLAICNGVLEWIPVNHNESVSPTKFQLCALKDIQRSLSRSGLLWIGIENKASYGYLLGNVDHHSGLRFVTFLPRAVANLYSKLCKKQPYRTYLYNYWELKKILHKAGLVVNKSLTAFPNYPNPKLIADLSDETEIGKAALQMRLELTRFSPFIVKAITSLRLTKLLIPNFIILCVKSSDLQQHATYGKKLGL